MGYESKIFVETRHEYNGYVIGLKIAMIDLCKMGYERVGGKEFREVFHTPIDFDLFINDNETRTDCYGKHCNYASVDEVIAWLDGSSDELKRYRRAKLLRGFLQTLKESIECGDWGKDEIVLVHYGY